jgi:hypothetical protein
MSRLAVVLPLRPGGHEAAARLIEAGPPFELRGTPFERHVVFLSDSEVVFVFDGPGVRDAIEDLVGDSDVWSAAAAWRELADGRPRVAEAAFEWDRPPPLRFQVPGF